MLEMIGAGIGHAAVRDFARDYLESDLAQANGASGQPLPLYPRFLFCRQPGMQASIRVLSLTLLVFLSDAIVSIGSADRVVPRLF